jgi:hypothetical protein
MTPALIRERRVASAGAESVETDLATRRPARAAVLARRRYPLKLLRAVVARLLGRKP